MVLQSPELDGRVERNLIELAEVPGRDVSAAAIGAVLADAAGHAADALPELLILARGGEHFDVRLRPYLGEVIHCLGSALEAVLIASSDAERAGIGAARAAGEDDLAAAVVAYLDRDRG